MVINEVTLVITAKRFQITTRRTLMGILWGMCVMTMQIMMVSLTSSIIAQLYLTSTKQTKTEIGMTST